MPTVDKKVSGARGYSLILLTLMVAASVVVASEADRWIQLKQARVAVAQWLLYDFISEDFEDWWSYQRVEKHSIGDTYHAFSHDRLGSGPAFEFYYSGFGETRLQRAPPRYYISIGQPSREVPTPKTKSNIPDTRADIPDLRPWRMPVQPSDTIANIEKPLSKEDAAILVALVEVNNTFKKSNPEKAQQLPKLLQEEWSADKRWLALGAEKEKAAYQLIAVATSAGVEKTGDDAMPIPYRALERKLAAAAVKVPVIDVELPSLLALWSLATLALLIAVLLRVALADIVADSTAERQEDWLVLDATNGLGLGLARAWIIATILAPITIPIGVVFVDVLRWMAADATLGAILIESTAAVVLGATGCYISSSIFHQAKTLNTSLAWRFH